MSPYVGVWCSLPSGSRTGQAAMRKPESLFDITASRQPLLA